MTQDITQTIADVPLVHINDYVINTVEMLDRVRRQMSKVIAYKFALATSKILGVSFDRVVVLSEVAPSRDSASSKRQAYAVLLYNGSELVSPDSRSENYAIYAQHMYVFDNHTYEDVDTYTFSGDTTVEYPDVEISVHNS